MSHVDLLRAVEDGAACTSHPGVLADAVWVGPGGTRLPVCGECAARHRFRRVGLGDPLPLVERDLAIVEDYADELAAAARSRPRVLEETGTHSRRPGVG